MSEQPTIAIVGHCGADAYSLSHLARRVAPQANIVVISDEASLAAHRHARALWFVNRVLDGAFAPGSGIDLIRRHAGTGKATMALISNYADAQQQAVVAGAVPGFGKSEIGSPRAVELLRSFIDRHATSDATQALTGD
ncbi:MAG: hypothetical protein WD768_18030 [Phycisphaeraceae bacterium]